MRLKDWRYGSFVAAAMAAWVMSPAVHGVELHVGTGGDDANTGAADSRLRTIQRAADLAKPGDVVIVHGGVYRERISPPRGLSGMTRG